MIVLKKTLDDVKKELELVEEEILFLNRSKLQAESKFIAIEEAINNSLDGRIGKHRTMKYIKRILEAE
jgi:chaperonin cofactor prefoldin